MPSEEGKEIMKGQQNNDKGEDSPEKEYQVEEVENEKLLAQ